MKNTVIQVHEDDGVRTGLVVSVGRKWLGVIWPESTGMIINKIDIKLGRYHAIDYPVNRARRRLRKCASSFGITKAGRKALRDPKPAAVSAAKNFDYPLMQTGEKNENQD